MQMHGATPLELRMIETVQVVEKELPASKMATDIVVALSDGAERLQRLRRCKESLEAIVTILYAGDHPLAHMLNSDTQKVIKEAQEALKQAQYGAI